MSNYVIEHGGEIVLEQYDSRRVYDRIEFTDSGMVVCFNKHGYQKDCYPREMINEINTHTSDEEESAEWW